MAIYRKEKRRRKKIMVEKFTLIILIHIIFSGNDFGKGHQIRFVRIEKKIDFLFLRSLLSGFGIQFDLVGCFWPFLTDTRQLLLFI